MNVTSGATSRVLERDVSGQAAFDMIPTLIGHTHTKQLSGEQFHTLFLSVEEK
jgi:hypothetical protein